MRTENYKIAYRYIPGALGDGSSLDNGAVMVVARRTRASALRAVQALRANKRVQWARCDGLNNKRPGQ